ncbi:hypothetical protein EXIGUO8H_20353 [Exiguobacterium sp. 8H]|nr:MULTISPECIES: hypothetical protein [unclassified Exiguobacterium]VXB52303.1 hypothetical protein EXIGUO8A_11421 [Exiguobacterium sp. 8A]VXB53030.1 hypothetical protein EXIGUO8H_20353 [Exiguobacterium sp. 8H]
MDFKNKTSKELNIDRAGKWIAIYLFILGLGLLTAATVKLIMWMF